MSSRTLDCMLDDRMLESPSTSSTQSSNPSESDASPGPLLRPADAYSARPFLSAALSTPYRLPCPTSEL
eukprot:3838736-Rhodomonas_salina.1